MALWLLIVFDSLAQRYFLLAMDVTKVSKYSLIPAVDVDSWEAQQVNNIIFHQSWPLHLIACYKQYDIAYYNKE